MSPSKFLPSVYTIRGLRAAQGCVFLDVLSAKRWLIEVTGRSLEEHPEHVIILNADIIYYGGHLASKTTEDIQRERHAST